MTIDEPAAWDILHRAITELLTIDTASVLAVYAIGSLGGGYYRPGQSDIDAIFLTQDGSTPIWGDRQNASPRLRELNQRYQELYGIGIDLGPALVSKLFPPYDLAHISVQGIARLKVQGRLVYGHYDLDQVPMPTLADVLHDAQRYEAWWRDEYAPTHPFEQMDEIECVSIILNHLKRFLWLKRGIVEFDKRKVVMLYLANDPPFVDDAALRLVEVSLAGRVITAAELDQLRRWVGQLRPQMNDQLGIQL
jgi:hypothetical protein